MRQKTAFSFLAGFIKSQLVTVENILSRLEKIAPDTDENTDSLAYQIHNYYSALEDIFKEIQKVFESDLKINPSTYHKDLLKHMSIEMPKVRPRLISQSELYFLEEVLKFRHLFRHAYNYQLDPKRVHDLKLLVLQNNEVLISNIKKFVNILESNIEE